MTHSVSAIASPSADEIGRLAERDRIDQVGAGAGSAQLDQVGPLAVAEAVGPLGVHRDRTVPAASASIERVSCVSVSRRPGRPSRGP